MRTVEYRGAQVTFRQLSQLTGLTIQQRWHLDIEDLAP